MTTTTCPTCGALDTEPEAQTRALLAVCDVLVLRALELIGKRIVHAPKQRSRRGYMRDHNHPWHIAHTLWTASDELVDKSLVNAWDVVPAVLDVHGCCGVTSKEVTEMLDSYIHDLVITGTPHTFEELSYRFWTRLDLPKVGK